MNLPPNALCSKAPDLNGVENVWNKVETDLKKKAVQWRLGISLQSATRQELILFYVITFDLQVIKTQIGFHSKA